MAGYGVQAVLNGVSMDIPGGDCVGMLGRSGSGKSTMLKVITGRLRANRGVVDVAGWRPTPTPPPGLFGVVYQDPQSSLDRLWTVEQCVTEPLVAAGRRPERDHRAETVRTLLDRVRLGHVSPSARVTSLSVGQAQRVAMARALVAKPRVICADEPTSALDPTSAATVVRLLREAADAGAAVLVVSHNEPLLRSFCDRVVEMRDGLLV